MVMNDAIHLAELGGALNMLRQDQGTAMVSWLRAGRRRCALHELAHALQHGLEAIEVLREGVRVLLDQLQQLRLLLVHLCALDLLRVDGLHQLVQALEALLHRLELLGGVVEALGNVPERQQIGPYQKHHRKKCSRNVNFSEHCHNVH